MREAKTESAKESLGSFLDALTAELQRLLSEGTAVSWTRERINAGAAAGGEGKPSDTVWWSSALSVDPACRIYAGADRKTWKELSGVPEENVGDEPEDSWFGVLTQSIERAAKTRFGALVSCTERGLAEDSPGSRVSVAIGRDGNVSKVTLILSPDLAAALGGEEKDEETPPVGIDAPIAVNSLELLKHVEVPVSVSFGRAQMRLKDLLGLANGSVVQLDRELGDEVELRVNNRVIARGEVVAVNGNYGVRILRMTPDETASGQGGQGLRTALRAG